MHAGAWMLWVGVASLAPGFWAHWGDGRAEVSGYALTQQRYGAQREGGRAVLVFVTETFSESLRVKADPGKHPPADEMPVMKVNVHEHFQTGIYDYNVMTSAFHRVDSAQNAPAGALAKVAFSSQEWCGQVFEALWPSRDGTARLVRHSYFDGEGDQDIAVPLGDAWLADELFAAVRRYWGFKSLRPLQEQAIRAVLGNRTLQCLPDIGLRLHQCAQGRSDGRPQPGDLRL